MTDLHVTDTLTLLGSDGPYEVELCFGDITCMSPEDDIDILMLSSSSGAVFFFFVLHILGFMLS